MNLIVTILVLILAAFLEVWGDSWFSSALHTSTKTEQPYHMIIGTLVLGVYGLVVNLPKWDFGKLLGFYVVLFFVVAQVVAKVRFGQNPTVSIYVGGAFIVLGGLVIGFWRN